MQGAFRAVHRPWQSRARCLWRRRENLDRVDWSHLDTQLATHAYADEKEARDADFIRRFIADHPRDAHLRSQQAGHLTGSGFVIDAAMGRVLLLFHGKLRRWLQPGGHGEGETDPRKIAVREIAEETGLFDLRPFPSEGILDVDVHPIPARPGEPAHLHLDLRYGFLAPAGAEPRVSHESREVRWFALDDLPADADGSVRRAVAKLRRLAGI